MRRFFLLFCLISSGAALAGQASASPTEQSGSLSDLQFAASQHEIVSILIQQKQYSRVVPEFKKILDLNLSGQDEMLVVQSVWKLSEPLRKQEQFELAHRLVDETLSRVAFSEARFTLLMLKGKIYQEQDLSDLAIETYRRAQAERTSASDGRPD